ncbi:hypothetical protein HK099_003857, partial [Clydaea vesicula]
MSVFDMLQCHVKGCNSNNFPLKISEAQLENIEADFNSDFIKNMLLKLDWNALRDTALSLGVGNLPETVPEEPSEEFLKELHHVLLE